MQPLVWRCCPAQPQRGLRGLSVTPVLTPATCCHVTEAMVEMAVQLGAVPALVPLLTLGDTADEPLAG